jgi:probable rRNA maturation factor
MVDGIKNSIHFFFKDVSSTLRNRKQLKDFITFLFKTEKRHIENLNYIFCTDKFVRKINREYLKHDFYTDVISFDLSNTPGKIIGDIYISRDRIKENSSRFKASISRELHRVIFHGALHLCGYNDKSALQKKIMKEKEDYYLNLYLKMFHVK